MAAHRRRLWNITPNVAAAKLAPIAAASRWFFIVPIYAALSAEMNPPRHFLFAPSSAMYMISCLKMKRLGAPSRVSRTMFLS
jgi:hypothetical protein